MLIILKPSSKFYFSLTPEGSLRLTSDQFGSTSPNVSSGQLEVYAGGRWGTVCDDGFQQNDADVACRQLRYTQARSFDSVGASRYERIHFTLNLSCLYLIIQCHNSIAVSVVICEQ